MLLWRAMIEDEPHNHTASRWGNRRWKRLITSWQTTEINHETEKSQQTQTSQCCSSAQLRDHWIVRLANFEFFAAKKLNFWRQKNWIFGGKYFEFLAANNLNFWWKIKWMPNKLFEFLAANILNFWWKIFWIFGGKNFENCGGNFDARTWHPFGGPLTGNFPFLWLCFMKSSRWKGKIGHRAPPLARNDTF